MAQHDYVIANGTGAAVRSDLNNALAAIVSNNSGATEPTTTYAYMPWADTTTGFYKIRNGANSAWITLYQLDGEWSSIAFENGTAGAPSIYFKDSGTDTGLYSPGADQVAITTGGTARLTASTTAVTSSLPVASPLGSVGSPSLTFTGDLDTGVYSPGANQVAVATSGVQRVNFNAATEVVFNEDGADVDFRIEGDTKANLFKVDAGTDAISIDGAFSVTGDATVGSLNGGPLAGTRNRIINGDMRIDQRNAGASVTATGSNYALDRWQMLASVTSKFTVQQNAGSVTPPAGFTNYLGVTSSAATSLAGTDYYLITQKLEGFNTADLAWGTANAKAVTVSFWVRSSLTGTFGFVLRNSAGNRVYPASYTISAANTWEYKTVSITGDTTGTWVSDNSIGVEIDFGLGVGSTYSNASGTWTTGGLGTTGATSVIGTNGATFYITGVQLEAGSVATPFERRSYGQELALCQRYCPAISYYSNGGDRFLGAAGSTTNSNPIVNFQVTPRTAPTGLTVSSAGHWAVYNKRLAAGGTATAVSLSSAGANTAELSVTTTAGSPTLAAGDAIVLYPSNSSALMIFTGCEL